MVSTEMAGADRAYWRENASTKCADEARDLLAPLAERRHRDHDDVDPVVEVFPKCAGRRQGPELAAGGGDEADVGLDGLAAPGPEEPAVLEGVDELALEGQRNISDLFEEQGAAMGQLEPAELAPLGADERPRLVPEQLGLEQLPGQRRAVELEEGPVPPP